MKLYDRKNALVAADLLNDRVLPFLEEQNVPLLRVLTDRGTEYCGNRECHEYQLYLAVENIAVPDADMEDCQSPYCAIHQFSATGRMTQQKRPLLRFDLHGNDIERFGKLLAVFQRYLPMNCFIK